MGILLLAKRVVKRLSTKYMSHNLGYSCENEAESENAHHKAIVSKYVASRVMLDMIRSRFERRCSCSLCGPESGRGKESTTLQGCLEGKIFAVGKIIQDSTP